MKLRRWLHDRKRLQPGARRPTSPRLSGMRLFVVDVDVTGINSRLDRATGIASLRIDAGEFSLRDIQYCPIAADTAGWRDRYRSLIDDIADNPVITYNAPFVKHMIRHAADEHGVCTPLGLWIDIATALYGTVGNAGNEIASMAAWQERMKIRTVHAHSAVADVFAIAQTVQTLLAYCEEIGIETLDDLKQAQDARTWLRG